MGNNEIKEYKNKEELLSDLDELDVGDIKKVGNEFYEIIENNGDKDIFKKYDFKLS